MLDAICNIMYFNLYSYHFDAIKITRLLVKLQVIGKMESKRRATTYSV